MGPSPASPSLASLPRSESRISATLYGCRGGVLRIGAVLAYCPSPSLLCGCGGIRGWMAMKRGGRRCYDRFSRQEGREETQSRGTVRVSWKEPRKRIISLHEEMVLRNNRVQTGTPRDLDGSGSPVLISISQARARSQDGLGYQRLKLQFHPLSLYFFLSTPLSFPTRRARGFREEWASVQSRGSDTSVRTSSCLAEERHEARINWPEHEAMRIQLPKVVERASMRKASSKP
jgi:hypothetical protein